MSKLRLSDDDWLTAPFVALAMLAGAVMGLLMGRLWVGLAAAVLVGTSVVAVAKARGGTVTDELSDLVIGCAQRRAEGGCMNDDTVTVHIEDVPIRAITHVLVAIEQADLRWFDDEQHQDVTPIVLGLRQARRE